MSTIAAPYIGPRLLAHPREQATLTTASGRTIATFEAASGVDVSDIESPRLMEVVDGTATLLSVDGLRSRFEVAEGGFRHVAGRPRDAITGNLYAVVGSRVVAVTTRGTSVIERDLYGVAWSTVVLVLNNDHGIDRHHVGAFRYRLAEGEIDS